jgi:SSS family solute:Na+ symporter
MLIIGGSYVVCPMLFSRLLSAKNEKTAYKSALMAVPILLITAFIIVYIGLMLRNIVPKSTVSTEVLTNAISSYLPKGLSLFLSIALLSAIVSSADSCLITSSTVICNDIFKSSSVFVCRIITITVGLISFLLSLRGNGILSLLFAANDIFVAGIVSPVFVSMVIKKKYRVEKNWIIIAMIVGGSFGLSAALTSIKSLSMLGVLLSIILSLIAIRKDESYSKNCLPSTDMIM